MTWLAAPVNGAALPVPVADADPVPLGAAVPTGLTTVPLVDGYGAAETAELSVEYGPGATGATDALLEAAATDDSDTGATTELEAETEDVAVTGATGVLMLLVIVQPPGQLVMVKVVASETVYVEPACVNFVASGQ